jgi:hypothetical protein
MAAVWGQMAPLSCGPAEGVPCDRGAVDRAARRAYVLGMSDVVPTTAAGRQDRRTNWPLIVAGVAIGALLAAACALWVFYGTTVFFEIIRAGIAACL